MTEYNYNFFRSQSPNVAESDSPKTAKPSLPRNKNSEIPGNRFLLGITEEWQPQEAHQKHNTNKQKCAN